MVLALAPEGVDVVLTFRSHEAGARNVVTEVRELGATAVALRLAVERAETFVAFADELGAVLGRNFGRRTIDHLVNDAGYGAVTILGSTSVEEVDQLFQVGFRGPFFLTQALAPLVLEGGRSSTSRVCLPAIPVPVGRSTVRRRLRSSSSRASTPSQPAVFVHELSEEFASLR